MSNPAPNYHFVSKTASNFNILLVLHLALAVFTSIFGADVSSAIAVMGIIAFISANVPLLFLVCDHPVWGFMLWVCVSTRRGSQEIERGALVCLCLQYLPFTAVTILVDIIRLAAFKPAHAYGFLVFLKVIEMAVKVS